MIQALKQFLFKPDLPLWRYCLIAFPVALIPSLALSAAAAQVLVWAGVNVDLIGAPALKATFAEALGAIVVSPLAETLLLALILVVLSLLSSRVAFVALVSAIAWGCAHALFGAFWFFGTVWSFFVFSCAYLHWRKASFGKAFLAASIPHALINSTVMVLIALFGSKG